MSTSVPLVLNHRLSMKDNWHLPHTPKTIWVFRTSVTMHVDIRRLKPILDRLMHDDDKWNFDLEDCDHILRVETKSLSASEIIYHLEMAGYQCAELDDDFRLDSALFNPDLKKQETYFLRLCGSARDYFLLAKQNSG